MSGGKLALALNQAVGEKTKHGERKDPGFERVKPAKAIGTERAERQLDSPEDNECDEALNSGSD